MKTLAQESMPHVCDPKTLITNAFCLFWNNCEIDKGVFVGPVVHTADGRRLVAKCDTNNIWTLRPRYCGSIPSNCVIKSTPVLSAISSEWPIDISKDLLIQYQNVIVCGQHDLSTLNSAGLLQVAGFHAGLIHDIIINGDGIPPNAQFPPHPLYIELFFSYL